MKIKQAYSNESIFRCFSPALHRKLQENLSKKELLLQGSRQGLVRRIFTIFPLVSVDEAGSSTEDTVGNALTNALAEATSTRFVNGRWIVLDNETDDDASVVVAKKYLTVRMDFLLE